MPALDVRANETLKCNVAGCGERRWGCNNKCRQHATAAQERRLAAARKAVETRERNNPNWRKPKVRAFDWWQAYSARVVNCAKAAGVLPSLAGGDYACTDCGAAAEHYDHRDYARPLDVEPVCRACNVHRGPARFPQASDFQFKRRDS